MRDFEIINSFPSDFIFGTATSSYQIEGQKYGKCALVTGTPLLINPVKYLKGKMEKLRVHIY